uniref:Transposase (Putative), gypsy type n=1 Tax=Tanacetum cinerariifolium TaxID=118510 RepID=A0A699HSI4_TANCI|nr:hypothetical protein [Tanacetum cinerariifolium]
MAGPSHLVHERAALSSEQEQAKLLKLAALIIAFGIPKSVFNREAIINNGFTYKKFLKLVKRVSSFNDFEKMLEVISLGMGRDTVQLKTVVNTISHEYLLEFTSEYGIPKTLHPELPGPEDRIVDFPEGKVGVYTRFFEFANFRFPLSQFLFDVLGWMSFSKRPGKNTPQCYTKPLDSLKNWNNRFFWVDERVFPTIVDWWTNASKDGMPAESTYSREAVRALDTHRTPIQKQPEMLLCLVEISRRYYLRDEVYPTFLHDDDRDIDLFNLIRAPKSYDGEDWKPPTRPHEIPLLTLTATRVIEMDDPAAAIDSSSVPSTIERSPLDFAHEAGASDQGTVAPEMPPSEDVPATDAPGAGQAEETAATDPPAAPESRKRGRDRTDVNAPPKSLRRDHADPRPSRSSHRGKSLATIQLGLASTVFVPKDAYAGVNDPDPLSFADPPLRHPTDVAQSSQGAAAAGDPESENASSPVEVGSPKSIYRSEWGVANGSLLDTPEACQDLVDLVDHVAPSGYFSELRHMHNEEFLRQYNVNVARQVAMGSQLRLRFEQEAKLLRKSVAQVARQDKRIQAQELEIKNLEARLETEVDMKKAAEDKNAGLIQELEDICARFSDLQRCAESDARLDALSIDFDEELHPYMLTAIAGLRWVIGHGLRLAVMKCGESLEMRQAFADVVSAGIAKALQALKDLKYPLMDQLEGLKDAHIDVIMVALYLESDTGDDASQYIRDLRPSSFQLTIPVYPEVRDPRNPWAYREEMLLADAIAANVSRA